MATKITKVSVKRMKMPRVDPTWRTSSYAASSVEGFILEVSAGQTVGIGGTAAHPSNISGDDLDAQLNGPVRDILTGADVCEGSRIRESLRAANLHTRATIAADLAAQTDVRITSEWLRRRHSAHSEPQDGAA